MLSPINQPNKVILPPSHQNIQQAAIPEDMIQKPTDEELKPGSWIREEDVEELIQQFGNFDVVVKKYEGPREIIPISQIDTIPADNIREVFIPKVKEGADSNVR